MTVGDVPVETVQFGGRHPIQGPLDGVHVDVVSRSVEGDASVGESRFVGDAHVVGHQNLVAQVVVDDELIEGLEAVATPEDVVGDDGRVQAAVARLAYCQSVSFFGF